MEMTKKKWFTLLGFGAAVALPMSMIIHTANEGLEAAIITKEDRDLALSKVIDHEVSGAGNHIDDYVSDAEFDLLTLDVMYTPIWTDADKEDFEAPFEWTTLLNTDSDEASLDSFVYESQTIELDQTEFELLSNAQALEGLKFTDNTLATESGDEDSAYFEVADVAIDYTQVAVDEAYATITLTEVVAIDNFATVGLDGFKANFTFSAKEGYALVRTHEDADNSQAPFINFSKDLFVA